MLTSRDDPDNPLQKSGHACFVQAGAEWYILHLCARPLTPRGRCPLGRETALQKIEWVDGWPRLANGTCHPDLAVPAPAFAAGAVQPADHLSDDYIEQRRGRCAFTGAMVALCAQDMDAHRSFADFGGFAYREQTATPR